MPWKAVKRGSKWVVIKETTGKVVGTHSSKQKANAQVRALYANEKKPGKKKRYGKKA